MTRIDRYLLFLYLRVLGICFASIAGLSVVVQIFSNLDEFTRHAQQQSRSLIYVLADYFGPYTLSIFERLSGTLALLAFLFTVAWLNKTREFTALQAAGITKRRVVRPLLIASAGVILSAAALREFVIPQYENHLDRNPQDLTGEMVRPVQPTEDDRAGVLFTGKNLVLKDLQVVAPELHVRSGPVLPAFSKLAAARAVYHPSRDGKPAGYMLEEVSRPRKINEIPSIYHERDGGPVLLTSQDIDWVPSGSCFLVSNVGFKQLRGGSSWKAFVSTSELIAYLREKTTKGANDLQVMVHHRILCAAIDWTVLLIGLPILLARPDRNTIAVAGACLGMVTLFSGVLIASEALAASARLLSPMMAVWLPLLVFMPWGWARTQLAMET